MAEQVKNSETLVQQLRDALNDYNETFETLEVFEYLEAALELEEALLEFDNGTGKTRGFHNNGDGKSEEFVDNGAGKAKTGSSSLDVEIEEAGDRPSLNTKAIPEDLFADIYDDLASLLL